MQRDGGLLDATGTGYLSSAECSAARPCPVGRWHVQCQRGNPRASLLLMRRNTRSVGITPLLIGCSATERVQRDGTGVAPHNKCSAYCTRVREPELRASTAQQGFAVDRKSVV